jgi:hypothetical protein
MNKPTDAQIAAILRKFADLLDDELSWIDDSEMTAANLRWGADRLGGRDEKPAQSPHYPPDTKVGPAIVFDRGSLHVKQQGYAEEDGNGEFVFSIDDNEVTCEEGKGYLVAPVNRSDLLFLRDRLNKLFPKGVLASLVEALGPDEDTEKFLNEARECNRDRLICPVAYWSDVAAILILQQAARIRELETRLAGPHKSDCATNGEEGNTAECDCGVTVDKELKAVTDTGVPPGDVAPLNT